MRNRSIDGDDKIEHRDDCGGGGKISKFLAELSDTVLAQDDRLFSTHFFLQADKIHSGHGQHRGETRQRN